MARRYVTVSDLTGKEIKDGEEAEVRVLSHPLIDAPVKIDAQALEVAGLKGKDELVEIELVLPNTPPEKLVVDLAAFDKLFKHASADDVLNSAERYYESGNTPPTTGRRRGRPAGSRNKAESKPSGSGMSKEQLVSVREWLRSQGHEVSDRGRVKADLLKLWEEAHAS